MQSTMGLATNYTTTESGDGIGKMSVFLGPITDTAPQPEPVKLEWLAAQTRKGMDPELAQWIQDIRFVRRSGAHDLDMPELLQAMKEHLPVVSIGGVCSRRGISDLLQPSGYIGIDLDKLEEPGYTSPQGIVKEIKKRRKDIPWVKLAFVTCSGCGVRVIIQITPAPSTHDEMHLAYRFAFYALCKALGLKATLDTLPSSIAVPSYLSLDPQLYFYDGPGSLKWQLVSASPADPEAPAVEYGNVDRSITHTTLIRNSHALTLGGNISWEKIIDDITRPNPHWLKLAQAAQDALPKAGGLKKAPPGASPELKELVEKYGDEKRNLPALVPSVIDAPEGTPRKNLPYDWHSGCYSYDLDDGALEGLEGEERLSLVRAALSALGGCPHEVGSGESISNDGWTVISGPKAKDESEHHYYLRAIRDRLPEAVRILIPEKGQTEIGRLRYVAAGKFARYNPNNTPMVLDPPPAAEEAPPRAGRSSGNQKRRTPEEWMAAWPEGLVPLTRRSGQWEGPCPSCVQETGDGGDDRFHVLVESPHLFGCRKCVDPKTGKPDMRPYHRCFGKRMGARDAGRSVKEGGGTWFRIGEHIGNSLRAMWRYLDPAEGPTWARFQDGCWQEITTHDRSLIGFISEHRFRIAGEMEEAGWPQGAAALGNDRLWNAQKYVGSDLWDGLRKACRGQVPEPLPYHVGVKNGCVDLVTGERHPHRPECGQRALTAGRYLREDWERLSALLAGHFDPVFTAKTLQDYLELIGLSLTGEAATYRGWVLVQGKERSGKGGAVRLQRASLGQRSAAINADWFSRRAADIDAETANLLHRRPNSIATSEVGPESLQHRKKFLASVGGEDELSARRPHGATITGIITALWWSSCVDVPQVDVGDGMGGRLAVLRTIGKLSPGIRKPERKTFTQDLMDAVVTGAILTIRANGFCDDTPVGYVPPGGPGDAATAAGLAEMDPLADWLEKLPESWEGALVEEARAQAQDDLGEEITATRFGNHVKHSERWDKWRKKVDGVQGMRLVLAEGCRVVD